MLSTYGRSSMSLLDGDIAELFHGVFAGIYQDGVLTTMTRSEDPASAGNIISTPSSQPCSVQVDACTERQRLEAGYSAEDVRLLILSRSIIGPVKNGDRVTVWDVSWTVGPTVASDPALSYYECRGTPT